MSTVKQHRKSIRRYFRCLSDRHLAATSPFASKSVLLAFGLDILLQLGVLKEARPKLVKHSNCPTMEKKFTR